MCAISLPTLRKLRTAMNRSVLVLDITPGSRPGEALLPALRAWLAGAGLNRAAVAAEFRRFVELHMDQLPLFSQLAAAALAAVVDRRPGRPAIVGDKLPALTRWVRGGAYAPAVLAELAGLADQMCDTATPEEIFVAAIESIAVG